jgi:hypothetical protein
MNCRLCKKSIEERTGRLEKFDICKACARTLGVTPLNPPCRPARPCNRCSSMRFVRVMPRELTAMGGEGGTQAAPMALTIVPQITDHGWPFGVSAQSPNPWAGRGWLEAYVCLGCRYVEWYCLDPQNIPIGPEYMADIVDYTPNGPYR